MALVFNVTIGNCDAHGKNYSLLYELRAPSLAPFYDLLSTSVYEELTRRLAMSIDGATELEGWTARHWRSLRRKSASPPLLRERTLPFVEQVLDAAEQLSGGPDHAEPLVKQIVAGIRERSERFRRG